MRLHRANWKGPDGQRVYSSNWMVEVRTPNHGRKRIGAFRDKRASEEFGRRLEALCDLRLAGERPDAVLLAWLDTLPADTLAKLAKYGFVDAGRVAAVKTLANHLDDYAAALDARDNSPRHNQQEISKIRRIMDALRFASWPDIDAGRIEAWLAERRRHHGMSVRTSNSHVIAFKAFCRWAVKERRTPENPVAHLARLNDKVDRRRERRPLSPDELARLVVAARESAETKYGLSGLERSLVYRLATETGLRWSEIRSLARMAFALDADVPSVTIAPEDEKAGRGETLPLRKELAGDLAAYFKDHPAPLDARAFPMNVRNEGAKMVAFDLGHTGDPADVAAEKKARGERPLDTIPATDAAGRVADFHSLRHTFGTNLALAGVHPKVAQDLMRHSSIELTMNVYSHTKLESRAAALAGLPNVAPPANSIATA